MLSIVGCYRFFNLCTEITIWILLKKTNRGFAISARLSYYSILTFTKHQVRCLLALCMSFNLITELIPLSWDKYSSFSITVSKEALFIYRVIDYSLKIWVNFHLAASMWHGLDKLLLVLKFICVRHNGEMVQVWPKLHNVLRGIDIDKSWPGPK